MHRFLIALLTAATLLTASGCSTLADAKSARGTGTVRVYNKPYDAVWDAVIAAVKSTSLSVAADNKRDGTVLAQGAVGPFSWGENVAIYVEDMGGKVRTKVEIINKRAIAANITAADWERRLTAAIDARLGAGAK